MSGPIATTSRNGPTCASGRGDGKDCRRDRRAEKGQIKQGQYRDAWGKDTADLGEYDYYLRGHDVFVNANSKKDDDRAGTIWEEGLAKYPESSLIKVKLGFYHYCSWMELLERRHSSGFRKAGELARAVLAKENLYAAGEAALALALRRSPHHGRRI